MADQDEVEDYPFTNADEHMEEEEERDAKLIWVGVANSTKHKLKIKWSVSGARRAKKPSKLNIPEVRSSCSRNPVQIRTWPEHSRGWESRPHNRSRL